MKGDKKKATSFWEAQHPGYPALLLRAAGIWLVILLMAIANAGLREKALTPAFGEALSLPASGILLTVIILVIAFVFSPVFGHHQGKASLWIGAQWLAMTLAFEFLFGHFFSGKPWREVLEVFNVLDGNLFVLALLATFIAPRCAAKLRGLL